MESSESSESRASLDGRERRTDEREMEGIRERWRWKRRREEEKRKW